jgi:hypothetical protein
MHRLVLVGMLVACSDKAATSNESQARDKDGEKGDTDKTRRGPPDYDPTLYKKFSCTDLVPEELRATYKADRPEADRFGHCMFRSNIDADEVKCYFSVTCEKNVSAANAEEQFKRGTLSKAPVKLDGVGTVGFTDQRKPKSLYFMVIDEKIGCYMIGILPPGADVKALAGGTLEAVAKRL